MKLRSVVEGDGLEEVRFRGKDSAEDRVGLNGGSMADLRGSSETRFSFNEGENALEVAGAHDGVTFPMTEFRTVLGTRRAFVNWALSFELSAVIYAAVTLSSPFGIDSEPLIDLSTTPTILSYHPIDRRNTDGQLPGQTKNIADLVRAEIIGQQVIYPVPLGLRELAASMTRVISCGGIGMGHESCVPARGPQVAPKFPIECAGVTA